MELVNGEKADEDTKLLARTGGKVM